MMQPGSHGGQTCHCATEFEKLAAPVLKLTSPSAALALTVVQPRPAPGPMAMLHPGVSHHQGLPDVADTGPVPLSPSEVSLPGPSASPPKA